MSGPDRYEPMPGILGLPRFLWRKLPGWGKGLAGLLVVGAAVATILSIPGIDAGKREDRKRDEQAAAAARQARIEQARRIMRPRLFSVMPEKVPGPKSERIDARRRMLSRTRREILADAREREETQATRVACEFFPTNVVSPLIDLRENRARLSCVAITSELEANERTTGVEIGYPYRALVDFLTGRVGYCRTVAQPGEGSYTRLPDVPTPAACGG